ncbi:hypothetical protein ACFWWC_03405 [Streptomyces sp. NPDC058642]|uniref:hypothetical protein n=1 Tax=Streptomyces sp. NPDC058642 TaxID=3346572 RepID=UPI003657CF23
MLSGECLPKVYVSGDNASLDRVREIADREGPFDVALTGVTRGVRATVTSAMIRSEAATVQGADRRRDFV